MTEKRTQISDSVPNTTIHYPSDGWVDGGSGITAPHIFIQWKGTDVCLDFHCECGERHHVDAEFVYGLQCTCGATYDMPSSIALKRVPAAVEMTYVCTGDDD